MKKGIHPENYRLVAFRDMSNGETFITRSCADSKETVVIDKVEYPLIKREITSSSHPFYTGKMKLVDSAGRVDKFYSRFGKSKIAAKKENPVEEEAVAEVAPVAEEAVAEASTEEASTEEASTEEASTEEVSTEEASTEEASTEESTEKE